MPGPAPVRERDRTGAIKEIGRHRLSMPNAMPDGLMPDRPMPASSRCHSLRRASARAMAAAAATFSEPTRPVCGI